MTLGLTHHVRTGVNAVAQVDIEMPRGAEHRSSARRGSSMGVCPGIRAVPQVGLHFEDAPDEFLPVQGSNEIRAYQRGCDLETPLGEEGTGVVRAEPHSLHDSGCERPKSAVYGLSGGLRSIAQTPKARCVERAKASARCPHFLEGPVTGG